MKLVFASNNKHKLEEVRQILPTSVEVVSLREIGFVQEIEETGETLEANSALKAREVWNWLKKQDLQKDIDGVFADDTGLEIAALNGAPGVRTARWAGDEAKDVNNRQKALRELDGVTHRDARFRTVVTLIMGDKEQQVEGIVNGKIATQEEGEGGFGYDPVFLVDGYGVTMAEMSEDLKNTISHRANALAKIITYIKSELV